MKEMIDRATVADAEEILSLQKLAYRSEAEIYDDFNIPPLLQTPEEIKKDFENQTFLKATLDGKIRGSVRAFIKEGTCYIGRLIVHPDFQNRGMGKELMQRIEEIVVRRTRRILIPSIPKKYCMFHDGIQSCLSTNCIL